MAIVVSCQPFRTLGQEFTLPRKSKLFNCGIRGSGHPKQTLVTSALQPTVEVEYPREDKPEEPNKETAPLMEGDRGASPEKESQEPEACLMMSNAKTQVAPPHQKKPQPPAQCVPSCSSSWRGPTRRQLHGLSSPGKWEVFPWTRPAASWTAEYRGDEVPQDCSLLPLQRAFLRETVTMLPPGLFPLLKQQRERKASSVFRKSKSLRGLGSSHEPRKGREEPSVTTEAETEDTQS